MAYLLGSQTVREIQQAGSLGDPNGDPNSNVLEGISKGSGRVWRRLG
jgi:hypothetical protein